MSHLRSCQEFDRILEVNGVRGSSVELAKALGSGSPAAMGWKVTVKVDVI